MKLIIRIIIPILFTTCFMACKQDDSGGASNSIITGNTANMLVVSYDSVISNGPVWNSHLVLVDMNKDSINDFYFLYEYTHYGNSGGTYLVHLFPMHNRALIHASTRTLDAVYSIDSTREYIYAPDSSITDTTDRIYYSYSLFPIGNHDQPDRQYTKLMVNSYQKNEVISSTTPYVNQAVEINEMYPIGTTSSTPLEIREHYGKIRINKYTGNSTFIPFNKDAYIGVILLDGSTYRLGWIKLIINGDRQSSKTILLETALQK